MSRMADKPKSSTEKQKERSAKLQAQIEESAKRKQERQFLEELGKRMTIAREGRVLIERHDFPAAMAAYRRFLSITARSMNVEIADMSPSLVEEKNRVSESLIISSIFFDLLKLLDKLNTENARQERLLYHKLFIRFTKGMPFQQFAAENLRKHLVYVKTLRNKSEFWTTYKAIQGEGFCIVASWAFDSSEAPEVARLRQFRGEVLMLTRGGRLFTRWYYRNGQRVAEALAVVPGAKPVVKSLLRTFVTTVLRE